jgi:hypothetical protein
MAFAQPGGQNTFVATTELSGNLAVNFGRNIKNFPVNKYLRLRTVTKTTGLYTYFNPLDYARFAGGVTNGQTPEFDWAPGTAAPTGWHNTIGFEHRSFQCRRKAYPCNLDLLGEQQADWPVLKTNTEAAAQLAMTDRALEAAAAMTNAANYPSTHVDTATNFSAPAGGFLNGGSATDPRIKRAFQTLSLRILKDSGGNVRMQYLTVVMNPDTAVKLSQSQEVHALMKESRYALPLLTGTQEPMGNVQPVNFAYGLPEYLYGFRVVVEDTTYNSFNRGDAAEAISFVFPDNVIAMVSREQDFEAAEGANSYTTFHLFVYGPDDMKVESETDTWNRIIKMRVTDNRQVVAVAGVTGGLITNCFS